MQTWRKNKTRAPRRARRGVSLVEVMVTVLLTGLSVGVFSTSFPGATNALSRSRQSDVANNACVQQLEYWRNIGYSSVPIPNGAAQYTRSFTPPAALVNASGQVTFTRVTDSFAATTADTGQLKVEARITWQGTGRDAGTAMVTTLLVQ